MSEAMSTSEIEDVLSSIRRLVSDDLRPAPKPVEDEASKLLLTPALRVVQNPPEPAEARGIDDVVATLGASVDQQDGEWEPETGDTSLEVAEADTPAQMWEDAPVIEDYATNFEFHSLRSPEAVTQDEAPVAEAVVEAEVVEAVEAAIPPVEEAEALPGWAQSAGAEEADEARPEPLAEGTVEPDPVWADAAEAAVLQELQGAAPLQDMVADEAVEDELADLPVDEAMLREIVRDVLREELQGRLGERITRNIRKLVRAEIARTLASDELL